MIYFAELGDRGRDFSAKDLVSSVFSAANKKIRRREKTKGGESIDIDFESESSYQERNIDAEIEHRIGRVATEGASMIAGTTTGHVTKPEVASENSSSDRRTDDRDKNKVGSPPSEVQESRATYSSGNSDQYSNYSNVMTSQSNSQPNTSHSIHSRQDLYQAKLAFVQGTADNMQQAPDTRRRFTDTMRKPTSDEPPAHSNSQYDTQKPPQMRPLQGYPAAGKRKHSLDAQKTPVMPDKFRPAPRNTPSRPAEVNYDFATFTSYYVIGTEVRGKWRFQ